MTRDYAAAEVTIGSKWYVWGAHYEVVERFEEHANEAGAPEKIPMVKLHPLNSDGTRKRTKVLLPIAAWRVLHYGQPSAAFS